MSTGCAALPLARSPRRALGRALLALLATLSACTCQDPAPAPAAGPGGPPTAEEGPRGTLVLGAASDVGALNPVVAQLVEDQELINAVSWPPLQAGFDCRITYTPRHFTSWTFDEDAKGLRVTLDPAITWADGTPVTSADILFTYELIADPAVASPRAGYLDRFEPGYPKADGDHAVIFRFTEPFSRITQLSVAGMIPVPAHALRDADRATLRGNPLSLRPLSSGPWAVTAHEPGERTVLEPNPAFTGPAEARPKLRRIIKRVIPDYATRLLELKAGRIDYMDSLALEDAVALRRDHPELRVITRRGRTSDYLTWNLSNPRFSDVRVRTALAHAADIDGIVRALFTDPEGNAHATRAVSTITPALCGAHADDIQPLAHDLARARALLDEAGWRDADGDGVRDKDGVPLRFKLSTNAGNKRREEVALLLQAAFKRVGAVADIELVEPRSLFDRLRGRDYDAMIAGWSAGLFIDPSNMWHSDTPTKTYAFNFPGYRNPAVDALIDKGLSEPDDEVAAEAWKEMQRLIYADQPYMFLWWLDEPIAVHRRFQDTQIDVLSRLGELHAWWVPADEVKYPR